MDHQSAFGLARLYDFLAPVNKRAAAKMVQALAAAPNRLREHPRIGEPIDEFQPHEVRRILAGDYEIRYEIRESTVSASGFGTQGRTGNKTKSDLAFSG